MIETLHAGGVDNFDVLLRGSAGYPPQLYDAEHPLALLYCGGRKDLLASP
ncbi:hypothetical protein [Halorhodospira halochloris]|nr:hypothetical protein [Halorhodospira halochloris]